MTKKEWDQRDCVCVVERLGVFMTTGTYVQNLLQRERWTSIQTEKRREERERGRERERERETERERRKEIKDYKSISRYIIKSRGNFSSYRSHQLNRTKAIDISSVILVKIVELIIYHKRSFYIFREGE